MVVASQVSLFENIKPLFAGKPLVLVATKIDLMPLSKLSDTYRTKVSMSAAVCAVVRGVRTAPPCSQLSLVASC
jgi:GTP1/Obg family GTP-binding protein